MTIKTQLATASDLTDDTLFEWFDKLVLVSNVNTLPNGMLVVECVDHQDLVFHPDDALNVILPRRAPVKPQVTEVATEASDVVVTRNGETVTITLSLEAAGSLARKLVRYAKAAKSDGAAKLAQAIAKKLS